MKDALFGGVNIAIPTPMNKDLSPNAERMAQHCNWLLANGATGLGILGTTGEANSIGVSERLDFIEAVVKHGVNPKRLMPGVGTPALTDTAALVKKCASVGIPGVLMLPPFFYKDPSEDGLFAYYSDVVQRAGTGTKIYLYHIPQQSAVAITVPLIARLRKAHPGVFQGIKDSSGDFNNMKSYVENFAKDGFEVYTGGDAPMLQLMRIGGAGCLTAAANVASPLNAEVFKHYADKRGEDAQNQLNTIVGVLRSVPVMPALKSLLARNTGHQDWLNLRPPFSLLTEDQKSKLFAAFDATGTTLAKAA